MVKLKDGFNHFLYGVLFVLVLELAWLYFYAMISDETDEQEQSETQIETRRVIDTFL